MKIAYLEPPDISANDPIARIELPPVFGEFGRNAKLKSEGGGIGFLLSGTPGVRVVNRPWRKGAPNANRRFSRARLILIK